MQDYKEEMKHLKKDIKAWFVTKVYFWKIQWVDYNISDS
jgi:hypothetical protein